MKLIVDSGSSKTTWYLLTNTADGSTQCLTAGINPFFQKTSDIIKTLKNEYILEKELISAIYFYGAGITDQSKKDELYGVLSDFFGLTKIHIESDLLAAARSLCGNEEGIAAILGTGSNSCYYDGEKVTLHVSPLGYILGDEGSGAVMGRLLVADVLKNQFPQSLTKHFYEKHNTTKSEVMEHVYRKPFPNRYLASFTKFMLENIHEEKIANIISGSFTSFFNRNIAQYPQSRKLPVQFTGSVAWHFSDLLKDAASKAGFSVGRITQNPMHDLLAYHKK